MARQYKRKFRITFTPSTEEPFEVSNINADGSLKTTYIRCLWRLPILYGDLSGTGELDIYNLSTDHQRILKIDEFLGNRVKALKDGISIVDVKIEAGYEDDSLFSVIYTGTIIFGRSAYESPNWVTRIQLSPSVNVQRSIVSLSQPKGAGSLGTPTASIIKQCTDKIKDLGTELMPNIDSKIAAFGKLVDDKNTASGGAALKKGVSKSGNPLRIINNMLNQVDCNAWIDPSTNTLFMDKTDIVSGGIVGLSSTNGLVGVPEESRNTIKFVSLLNPALKPGIGVRITSKTTDTQLLHLNSTDIDCDTHGSKWHINMEGAKVGG